MRVSCPHCRTAFDFETAKVKPQANGLVPMKCRTCLKSFQLKLPTKAPATVPTASNTPAVANTNDPFWQPPVLSEKSEPAKETPVAPTPAPVVTDTSPALTAEFGSMDEYDNSPTDDIWSQMAGLDTAAPTAPTSFNDVPAPPTLPSVLPDEQEFVNSLESEKKKVIAETQRLENLSQRMVQAPPPPKAPIPAKIVKPVPPPPPPAPKKPPEIPRSESSYNKVPLSQEHKNSKIVLPPKKSENLVLFISAGLFFLAIIGVVVMYFIYNNSSKPFRSRAIESSRELGVPEKTTPTITTPAVVESPTTATIAPTSTSTPEVLQTQSPYDAGITAYQLHHMDGYRQAEKLLLQAYKEEEKSPRTLLALSELYAVLGGELKSKSLLDKSFKLAQSQINHHEVAALAYRALSQAYLYSGQFQKASEAIDKALNLDSKDKESYLIRGLAMHQLRQGGAGLIQAYQMEPPTYRSMLELYRYYLEMQRLNDAKQVAHKIIKTFPLRYEGALFAMRIAAKQNNFSEALSLGEQAVLLESDNIPLHIELAQLYFDAQRPEKANELLRLLLTRSPKMPRDDLAKIYLILGKCNVNNRPQEAVIYFSQLLKWDVEPTSTLNYLGLAHYNLKEYQPSADYFARALRRTPDNLQIKFNLALTHFSAGSFNRAEQLFQEIRTVEPRHEEATLYLANVYDKKGDRLKAIEIFEKVLAINPNNVLAQKQMQRLKSGQ